MGLTRSFAIGPGYMFNTSKSLMVMAVLGLAFAISCIDIGTSEMVPARSDLASDILPGTYRGAK